MLESQLTRISVWLIICTLMNYCMVPTFVHKFFKSRDLHACDSHGKRLLSLSKTAGLRKLNGRSLDDHFGQCTCFSHNGMPSVIDYMLSSIELLNYVDYFHVHSPMYISIHCLLSYALSTGLFRYTPRGVPNSLPPKYCWSIRAAFRFQH